jgi:hypothetical protein
LYKIATSENNYSNFDNKVENILVTHLYTGRAPKFIHQISLNKDGEIFPFFVALYDKHEEESVLSTV